MTRLSDRVIRPVSIFSGILAGICMMLIFLYISVCAFAFNPGFYEAQYVKNDTYKAVKMNREDLSRVTRHMIDYMRGQNDDLNIQVKVDGKQRDFFDKTEILHMKDVKALFQKSALIIDIAASLLVVILVLFLVFMRRKLLSFLRAMRNTSAIFLLLLMGIVAAGIINFDTAFTVFHQLLFTNRFWELDPAKDLLTNIVPEQFFISIAIFIGICFYGIGLIWTFLLSVGIRIIKKRNKKQLREAAMFSQPSEIYFR